MQQLGDAHDNAMAVRSALAAEEKNGLLAEQVPEPPGRIEPQRRAPGVERHRLLHLHPDGGAELANSNCIRTCQWPKFGNDTTARRPMRSMCSSTTRGWRVACSVCDRIT